MIAIYQYIYIYIYNDNPSIYKQKEWQQLPTTTCYYLLFKIFEKIISLIVLDKTVHRIFPLNLLSFHLSNHHFSYDKNALQNIQRNICNDISDVGILLIAIYTSKLCSSFPTSCKHTDQNIIELLNIFSTLYNLDLNLQ